MNRQTLDRGCKWSILGLMLGILIFGPLAMGAVDAPAFLVIQGLAVLLLLVWALRLWISPKPQLFWPPLGWVVLAFAALAIGRYLTADIEYVARQEMIRVLLYAFLFFAIINNLYRQELAQIISFPLIFLATGIACFAVYQFITRSNQVWSYVSPYTGRASGTYISPNNLAGFLEMLLPLAAAYVLVGRMKPVVRILLGYAVLAMLGGMVVTFSRGGWAAVAVALLVMLVILTFHRNHRLPSFVLLVILAGGGTIFVTKYLSKSLSYIQRVGTLEDGGQLDYSVRRDMGVAAGQMWRDHFWWGVGPAHYDYRFRQYRPQSVQLSPDRVHNDYLNLVADWGAIGGIIVLAGLVMFGAGLKKTWKHVRPAENDFGRGLSNRFAFFLGASTGLLALAVHSAVDFNLHIPANAILGVTLLALLSSNLRFSAEHYWLRARPLFKVLMTLALVAGVVCFAGQGWQRAHEAIWLAQAEQSPVYSPAQAANLEKALAAEPMNFETTFSLGEAYRVQSFDGGQDYEKLAQKALHWYERGMKLNPHDGYNYLRYGMCLDWLDRHDEAGPYFDRADALDPNGYFTEANIGWHYIQIGDYAAARPWLERSSRLHWQQNGAAASYLEIVDRKLADDASGQGSLPAVFEHK
jgi:O-antigen ligase/Tfp pilus assembly protein PilF